MSQAPVSPHAMGAQITELMRRVDRYHRAARLLLLVGAPSLFLLHPEALVRGYVPAWALLLLGYLAAGAAMLLPRMRPFSRQFKIGAGQVMEVALLTAIMMAMPKTVGVVYVILLVLTLRTGLRHGSIYLATGTALTIAGLFQAMCAAQLFNAEPELTFGLLLGPLIIPLYMGKVCETLVAARDDARRADTAKSRFLANMSHEFRTPLNSIQGMADLLACSDLPDSALPYVRSIRSSAQGLGENVQELLDFATIEAGRIKVLPTVFAVRALTETVRNEMIALAEKKGLEFRLRVADNVPELVHGDEVHAKRALISLICNAIKFTDEGWVEVHVSTQHRGSDKQILCFRVRDSGPGFAEAVGEQLFEPFEQMDSSLSRQNGGTGLGLAIARGFVRANNGDIGFKSAPGVGSEFWFTFEVGHVTEEQAQDLRHVEASVSAPDEASEPLNILVVDDQASNRVVFEAILRRAGHAVTALESGKQAINHLTKHWADMVLVDLHMPGLSGVEVLRWIRSRELARDLQPMPVLVVTADGTNGAHTLVMEHGATSVVTKPVSMQELLRNIRLHSAGRQMSQLVEGQSGAGCYLSELRRVLGNDASFSAYLDQALEDLHRIVAGLEFPAPAGSTRCIAETAHAIKGVAGNLGLELIHKLAVELETCAQGPSDSGRLAQLIADIKRLSVDGSRVIRERFGDMREIA